MKAFAKNEKELEALIQTIRIYSKDIGMEFAIKTVPCWWLQMGKEKQRKE